MQKKYFTDLPTLFFFGPLQETNNFFFRPYEIILFSSAVDSWWCFHKQLLVVPPVSLFGTALNPPPFLKSWIRPCIDLVVIPPGLPGDFLGTYHFLPADNVTLKLKGDVNKLWTKCSMCRGGSSLKNWAMHLWRIWKNEGARRGGLWPLPRAPQARSTLRRGVRGPLKAPGKFFICRCSEMHSPAFSEQLMEHNFHCKFI